MAIKWYDIKISNVTLIGDFPYFEDTDCVKICNLGFGTYKGISVKKWGMSSVHSGDCYRTKKEAIEKAKKHYESNGKFEDGTIPFEIVFYLRGIGWQIFSGNTINNDILIKKKLGMNPYHVRH